MKLKGFSTLLVCALTSLLSAETPAAPDLAKLLERVAERSNATRAIRNDYCYVEEETDRKIDSKGKVKSEEVKTFEVFCIPGGQVRRLISKNGQPLTETEAQAEEARLQKRLEEIEKERVKNENAAKNPYEIKNHEDKGNNVEMTPQDLLAVIEVKKAERTTFEGMSVLAMDLGPKRDAKISGLGQRLASKLEGRIFVDEANEQIVAAEGRLLDSFWIGGGLLASIKPPTRFQFKQTQVEPGLWMPTDMTFTAHARVTVVPMHREFHVKCWNYKKFTVDVSEAKLLPALAR